MKVTILKLNKNLVAVSAETTVTSLEQLVTFSSNLGYTQPIEEFVSDFNERADVTYSMELANG